MKGFIYVFFEVGEFVLKTLFWAVFVYGLFRVFKATLFRQK